MKAVSFFTLLSFPLLAISQVQETTTPVIIDDSFPRVQQLDTSQSSVFYTARAGSETVQTDIETLVPILQGNLGFTFATLAYNFRDDGNSNFSGGYGARFSIRNLEQVIGGLRVHLDITETQDNHQIEQLGLGFDLFTPKGIDVHGNLYLADENGHSRGFGAPFASGYKILQDNFFEKGQSGADVQVRFPVPYLTELVPTRGFVGAYHFDGEFTSDLSGLMAGLTLSPLCGLNLGAEYYGNDEFYGSNFVFTVGGSLSLDSFLHPEELGRSISRALKLNRNNSCKEDELRNRIYRPGPRRNWVQTENYAIAKTILDNVVFVNNGDSVGNGIEQGSSNGNGTAESPVDTIQAGVTSLVSRLGGSGTVYVQAGTYNNQLDQTIEVGFGAGQGAVNTNFVSSAIPIPACDGYQFGGNTPRPTIIDGGFSLFGNAGGAGGTLETGRIEGFEIVGGPPSLRDRRGISAQGLSNLVISDNVIRNVVGSDPITPLNTGYGIRIEGKFFGEISRNTISGNRTHGINIENNFGLIENNLTVDNSFNGINVSTNNGVVRGNIAFRDEGVGFRSSTNNGVISGNTSIDTGNGFQITTNNGKIEDNISLRDGTGFIITNNTGLVQNNTATDYSTIGFFFQNNAGVIRRNTSLRGANFGIVIGTNSGIIERNNSSSNSSDGFQLLSNTGTFSNNESNNNLRGYHSGVGGANISGGTIENNTGSGNGSNNTAP